MISAPHKTMLLKVATVALPKVLKLVALILVDAFMARYLGVERFGLFSLVFAIFVLLAVLPRFGLENILVRDMVNGALDREALTQVIFVRLFGAFLAQLVFVGVIYLTPDLVPYQPVLIALSFGFYAIGLSLFEPLMQAKEWFGRLALAQSLVIIFGAGFKLAFIFSGASLGLFWTAILAETCLSALITFALLRQIGFLPRLRLNPRARRYAREGLPFLLASLSVIAYMRLDQIMLAAILDTKSVGLYSAALRVSESFFAVATIFSVALFPTILKLRQRSTADFEAAMVQLFRGLFLIGLAITIVLNLFADQLVIGLFGAEFAEAAPILRLHAWVMVPAFWGIASHRWLVSERLGRFELLRTVLGLGLNLALNFALIPGYGALGACVATIISQLVSYIGVNLVFKKLHRLRDLQIRTIWIWA